MQTRPLIRPVALLSAAIVFAALTGVADSYYTQRLADPRSVQVDGPTRVDDTFALQKAIDQVQQRTGQGIVFVPAGRYRVSSTLYIWPGIRLIGYGATRPVFALTANSAGFQDPNREKVMIFFAGARPGFERRRYRPQGSNGGSKALPGADPGLTPPTNGVAGKPRSGPIPDANPGTFYSALANLDIEVEDGNTGAVAVRARYAQHCYLAHMSFRLGPALAGVHEAGNVIEDVSFEGGRYGIWTSKPSPGWQLTVIDSRFEGQREAAIFEREAGLTLIRPRFLHVPTAVAIEPGYTDELWVTDARLEEVSGPAFVFGVEANPCNEINMENLACRQVPVFAELRDSGRRFSAPADQYVVKVFSHGLYFPDTGATPKVRNLFTAAAVGKLRPEIPSDILSVPPCATWANVRDLGAKGDGITDDTDALQRAIASHPAIYFPCGFYVVHDTLTLKPDSVLIGMHPGATQIILPDGAQAYQGAGPPKALLEAPRGGSNIVVGLGLYTSGNNPRAVAALWRAGSHSMMNDVRFLGGHGTPKPDGSRENPYNADHSADPDPSRRWDSQYPSLWVTDGGGGTFLDIWTPSTFARAGMLVSNTQTPGRVYQMSSEHHVRHEVQIQHAAHWRFYALQTEAERGESGLCLPVEVDSSRDIWFANLHLYRVISSYQPFPWAVKVADSRDVHFRNLHCFSNSKVSFDDAVYDADHQCEVRQREFAWLDCPARKPQRQPIGLPRVVAPGAKVEKLAVGFFNICGGTAAPNGDFYFVDAHLERIYRWAAASRCLSIISNAPPQPVNLACDRAGNLLVVSYAGRGLVYTMMPDHAANADVSPATLKAEPVRPRSTRFYLPVSDWRLNRSSLSSPSAHFISPDGTTVLAVGDDFLEGAMSWGVKSSPPLRSFGLAPAVTGQTFYVTDESAVRTWAATVNDAGGLDNFRVFAETGGEGVVADAEGNVFIAAGQVYAFDSAGLDLGVIPIPERPVQLAFGGPDHRTLFICARSSLYCVRTQAPGLR